MEGSESIDERTRGPWSLAALCSDVKIVALKLRDRVVALAFKELSLNAINAAVKSKFQPSGNFHLLYMNDSNAMVFIKSAADLADAAAYFDSLQEVPLFQVAWSGPEGKIREPGPAATPETSSTTPLGCPRLGMEDTKEYAEREEKGNFEGRVKQEASSWNTALPNPSMMAGYVLPTGEKGPRNMETLLSWARNEAAADPTTLLALIGKPTHPIPKALQEEGMAYWAAGAANLDAIPYGNPCGEQPYRELVANTFSEEYGAPVDSESVMFTIGGMGALYAAFYAINELAPGPGMKMVSTQPYYPLYTGEYNVGGKMNSLHMVPIMENAPYGLTATALEKSLEGVDPDCISCFVFCDPSNPLGTTPGETGWKAIGRVLDRYPKAFVILDEAYAEMVWDDRHVSLFTVAPPSLRNRIILLRSATKGLSAAGERLAVLISCNPSIQSLVHRFLFSHYMCVPRSMQHIYSRTLSRLSRREYYEKMAMFYKERVMLVYRWLKQHGLSSHEPQATFYVIANLSCMKGQALDAKAKEVLKTRREEAVIETDEDIAYHLLFEYRIAFAPMSYFGETADKCLLRITCADDLATLQNMLLTLGGACGLQAFPSSSL